MTERTAKIILLPFMAVLFFVIMTVVMSVLSPVIQAGLSGASAVFGPTLTSCTIFGAAVAVCIHQAISNRRARKGAVEILPPEHGPSDLLNRRAVFSKPGRFDRQ